MISMPLVLQDAPEACRALFTHWDEIRAGALVPHRAQLDPARLVSVLPQLQIVELLSHGVIRCKLAGTGLRDLFGFDITGRNMIELAPPEARPVRSFRYWAGVQRPCGSFFRSEIRYPSGACASFGGAGFPLLPDRAGGPPLVVLAIAAVADRGWINERQNGTLGLPEHFTFIDLGAGVPDSIDPPDGWGLD